MSRFLKTRLGLDRNVGLIRRWQALCKRLLHLLLAEYWSIGKLVQEGSGW